MENEKVAYKGMDSKMQCQGFQYEVGKEYKAEGDVSLCHNGFHACEGPLDVFDFYNPANSRFFEVEQGGDTKSDGTKTVSSKIKIKAEIELAWLIQAGVKFILERVKSIKTNTGGRSVATNTGDRSAATNTGESSVATNTGYKSAATNTGYKSAATNTGFGSAATNTGGRSVATNTGDRSAAMNTGYKSAATNTGFGSAATNTGGRSVATNTGDRSAAMNTGDGSVATNTGDRSAATNTGFSSAATNTGDGSAATNTGDRSAATNTGDRSAASVDGKESIACGLGIHCRAKAKQGWIVIADWRYDKVGDGDWFIKQIYHAKVGGRIECKKILPDIWYWFEDGKLESAKA